MSATKTDAATQLLIQSNKADVMKVKSRDGDNLGSVNAFMVNKRSGQSMYVVLTIGGFLGMGKAFYPLPFSLITFDPANDAYVVTIDRRVLEGGPSWANNAPVFDQAYADRVASYYGVASENLAV
ncbi:PRC-barrel domain containing protein [Sphingomonas koreensis]|nr:PRC-barrel domain containing protein [Sphingomonas koreensis]TPG43426.1 PRC-barrel domain containing protein [Sphingomonas koreensis]